MQNRKYILDVYKEAYSIASHLEEVKNERDTLLSEEQKLKDALSAGPAVEPVPEFTERKPSGKSIWLTLLAAAAAAAGTWCAFELYLVPEKDYIMPFYQITEDFSISLVNCILAGIAVLALIFLIACICSLSRKKKAYHVAEEEWEKKKNIVVAHNEAAKTDFEEMSCTVSERLKLYELKSMSYSTTIRHLEEQFDRKCGHVIKNPGVSSEEIGRMIHQLESEIAEESRVSEASESPVLEQHAPSTLPSHLSDTAELPVVDDILNTVSDIVSDTAPVAPREKRDPFAGCEEASDLFMPDTVDAEPSEERDRDVSPFGKSEEGNELSEKRAGSADPFVTPVENAEKRAGDVPPFEKCEGGVDPFEAPADAEKCAGGVSPFEESEGSVEDASADAEKCEGGVEEALPIFSFDMDDMEDVYAETGDTLQSETAPAEDDAVNTEEKIESVPAEKEVAEAKPAVTLEKHRNPFPAEEENEAEGNTEEKTEEPAETAEAEVPEEAENSSTDVLFTEDEPEILEAISEEDENPVSDKKPEPETVEPQNVSDRHEKETEKFTDITPVVSPSSGDEEYTEGKDIEKLAVVRRAFEHKVPASVAAILTGLPENKVRKLYRDLFS